MNDELTHFSLFSGIGGMDLAAEWAGFRTTGQCEKDLYCLRVLDRHFPGIPKFDDIRDLSADTLRQLGIECPTVLSGGFPCQPFSVAGKQRGKEDDRHLWPEMFRIVQELRPPWIVGENVAGIINMALDDILDELERCGYSARAFVFPAAAVGALHRRDRCFIVACDTLSNPGYDARSTELLLQQKISKKSLTGSTGQLLSDNDCGGCTRTPIHIRQGRQDETETVSCGHGPSTNPNQFNDDDSGPGAVQIRRDRSEEAEIFGDIPDSSRELPHRSRETRSGRTKPSDRDLSERERDLAYADEQRPQGHRGLIQDREISGEWSSWRGSRPLEGIWITEPELGRVANGIPSRVDRLRALGNAVVPQQVFPIFRAIACIEREHCQNTLTREES